MNEGSEMGDTTQLDRKVDARTAKRPPRRWRNRWRHTKDVVFESGFRAGPSVHLGPSVFPSREIAEERAAELLREHPEFVEMCGVIYLGAVPDPSGS
jgi:hypothetical protein